MHNIHDIKSIFSQNIFTSRMQCLTGTQNTKFKVIKQHKNDVCHV
jgi:hypothetical protein